MNDKDDIRKGNDEWFRIRKLMFGVTIAARPVCTRLPESPVRKMSPNSYCKTEKNSVFAQFPCHQTA
jgi:hypothetical protein